VRICSGYKRLVAIFQMGKTEARETSPRRSQGHFLDGHTEV
jgi:hypothetical protein